jgi:hypothetical protein
MAAPYFKQQLSVRFAARLEQVVTSSVRCFRLIYYEILGNQRNIRIIFYLRGIRATPLFQSQWGDEKCRTRAIPEGEIKEMGVSVCLTFFFLIRGDARREIYSHRSGSNSAISHNN